MTADIASGGADGELRAFVDRMLPAETRIAHVADLLPRCIGIDGRATSRGFYIASRLLGIRFEVGKQVCCALRINQPALAHKHAAAPDTKLIGFVYVCEPDEYDGTYKVGFSRDPKRRVAALSSKLRKPLVLMSHRLGTMLDEHARHCELRADRVDGQGEWFRHRHSARSAE